jgi:hypothetical protein
VCRSRQQPPQPRNPAAEAQVLLFNQKIKSTSKVFQYLQFVRTEHEMMNTSEPMVKHEPKKPRVSTSVQVLSTSVQVLSTSVQVLSTSVQVLGI